MSSKLITPRILKIDKIVGFRIFCFFNNGEHRVVDFESFFEEWNLKENKDDFRYRLLDAKIFQNAVLVNNTIGWSDVQKKITLSDGQEFDAGFELDPVVLFERSVLI